MKVGRIYWAAYSIPFAAPYVTSRGAVSEREGLIVELHTDAGVAGYGEAALPPDEQNISSLAACMHGATQGIQGRDVQDILDASLEGDPPLWPLLRPRTDAQPSNRAVENAVLNALDTAAHDAIARQHACSVAVSLKPARSTEQRRIEVNALITHQDVSACVHACRRACDAGFSTVKLKAGILDQEAEGARIAAVRKVVGSKVKLRLDPNGAWTVDQAIAMIRGLEEHDIEYVEQPVAPGDLEALRRVQDAVETDIAADEELDSIASALHVIEARAARVLVIKPQAVGGLTASRRIIDAASAAGLRVVLTTSIETGIGTAACLQLAATLPSGSPACGLATISLLEHDIATPALSVEAGSMILPDAPGLGVELDGGELQ